MSAHEVMMDGEDADEPEERKSRTQLKREHGELKELGEQLVALSPKQLAGIPLSEHTLEAILAAQGLARSALKRQLRYVAGLIEDEDVDALRSALDAARRPHADDVARLHETERWRAELIAGGEESLRLFVEAHPEFDHQRLRQLVQSARKERDLDKPPKSARQLFKYLQSMRPDSTQDA